MNASIASLRAVRLTPHIMLTAWRGITRWQLLTTFLLGCALSVWHFGAMGRTGSWRSDGVIVMGDQFIAFALLLALVVADYLTGKDAQRRGAYALAVITGGAAGLLSAIVLHRIMSPLFIEPQPFSIGLALYVFLDLVMIAGGTAWAINDRRRARLSRARMHGAELERIAAKKRSIESDLQAMQARVEPQFLFNTLAQVKRLYEQDPALAEQVLDELIAYLHAAMPKMRDTSSTVGQEIELARAYLAIVKLRLGDRLTYEIAMPYATRDVRMPPMMLLPLIDHTIAYHFEPRLAASATLCITVEATNDTLRVIAEDSEAGLVPNGGGDAIAGIRDRLDALYGAEASLMLRERGTGGTVAVIEIPYEFAAERARDELLGGPSNSRMELLNV